MIYKNVELFNADEIRETPGGIRMYRFPVSLIEKIRVKSSALLTTGIEIRFTGEANITLGAIEADGVVEIFRGDIYHSVQYLKKGESKTFMLTYESNRDKYLSDKSEWRIIFAHDFRGVLFDIEPLGKIEPPKTSKKKIFAYGSSISHGACSILYSNSNIYKLGHMMNCDIENKAIGGGCLCEKEICDYISQRSYDMLFLELGINMMGVIDADEMYKRVSYLISKLNLDIPTVLVSPYMHFRDISTNVGEKELSDLFAAKIKQISSENKKLHFIDGREIVDNWGLLTCDMVHPSVYGHRIIAERLNKFMGELEL